MKSLKIIAVIMLLILTAGLSCAEKHGGQFFKGALATVHPLATDIGADVLKRGGNALDCAVAVGFALAVVYPQAGNLGGGGFAIVYIRDSALVTTLDFREKAPLFATQNMFLDSAGNVIENASLLGYGAAAVPGTVAGLLELHRRFGSLPLDDLMQPALDLAENGFMIDAGLAADLVEYFKDLAQFPSTKEIFFKNQVPLPEGATLIQKDLAETLKRIQKQGYVGFYGGRTSALLEATMLSEGGLITRTDLQEYKPVWRTPISFDYNGLRLFSMAPPSSGGIMLAEIFNMAGNFDLPKDHQSNPMFVHLFTEICKRAYADYAEYLGDMDFVKIPLQELLSQEYAKSRLTDFNPTLATPSEKIAAGVFSSEAESTTHFSIIDRYGNAVGITYTLNAVFGAKVVADSLGFFLNNEMNDFAIKAGSPNLFGQVGGEANKIAPQKRPLSSLCPTLVFGKDSLLMISGSSGGSKIITTVALSIFRYFHFDLSLKQAINQPKYHHQHTPDLLYYEIGAFEKNEAAKLTEMGHILKERSSYGNLNAIARKSPGKAWEAESDNRKDGKAEVIY